MTAAPWSDLPSRPRAGRPGPSTPLPSRLPRPYRAGPADAHVVCRSRRAVDRHLVRGWVAASPGPRPGPLRPDRPPHRCRRGSGRHRTAVTGASTRSGDRRSARLLVGLVGRGPQGDGRSLPQARVAGGPGSGASPSPAPAALRPGPMPVWIDTRSSTIAASGSVGWKALDTTEVTDRAERWSTQVGDSRPDMEVGR